MNGACIGVAAPTTTCCGGHRAIRPLPPSKLKFNSAASSRSAFVWFLGLAQKDVLLETVLAIWKRFDRISQCSIV